jgi:putative tryptophan/tyrosine transport system substrate-binding protein
MAGASRALRLRDLGYVEGRNLVIEYRDAEGKFDRLPALAAELVALKIAIAFGAGLSDSLLPDLRAREAMAWDRLVDEPPPPSALSKSLDWLALPAGMLAGVLYIWAMLLAVVIMPFWLIGRGLWKKITHSKS